jgi:hypothetical protein
VRPGFELRGRKGKGSMEKLRQTWEPMRVVRVGSVAEVLREGGGKLTPAGGDPGEGRKQGPVG